MRSTGNRLILSGQRVGSRGRLGTGTRVATVSPLAVAQGLTDGWTPQTARTARRGVAAARAPIACRTKRERRSCARKRSAGAAKVFPLTEAAEAVRYLIENRPYGRINMQVPHPAHAE